MSPTSFTSIFPRATLACSTAAIKSSAGVAANPPRFARVMGVLHALTMTTSSGDLANPCASMRVVSRASRGRRAHSFIHSFSHSRVRRRNDFSRHLSRRRDDATHRCGAAIRPERVRRGRVRADVGGDGFHATVRGIDVHDQDDEISIARGRECRRDGSDARGRRRRRRRANPARSNVAREIPMV